MNIQELCDRYNIKSRKSLYSRLDGLRITLAKDGNKAYATDEQVALLDQQDEHLKNGGTIKNFVTTTQVTVDNTVLTQDKSSIVETTQHSTQLTTQPQLLGDIVEAVTTAITQCQARLIADKMTPADPLWYLGRLEAARASGWELTTSEVQKLIGVKPSCKKGKRTFKRGSFIFVKSGKIGNQTSWKVQKVTDDDGYKV